MSDLSPTSCAPPSPASAGSIRSTSGTGSSRRGATSRAASSAGSACPPTCADARCSTSARGTGSSRSRPSGAAPRACWQSTGRPGASPPGGRTGTGRRRRSSLRGARSARASRIATLELDEIGPDTIGRFDVVLFLGVLYHLKHPWPVLERVASVCDGLLIVETHADLLDLRRPAMALYPGAELSGDASNWWGPNVAALTAMLREEGFTRVEVVHREPRAYRFAARGLPAAARTAVPRPAGARDGARAPRRVTERATPGARSALVAEVADWGSLVYGGPRGSAAATHAARQPRADGPARDERRARRGRHRRHRPGGTPGGARLAGRPLRPDAVVLDLGQPMSRELSDRVRAASPDTMVVFWAGDEDVMEVVAPGTSAPRRVVTPAREELRSALVGG